MAKDQGAIPTSLRQRTPVRVPEEAKKRFDIVQFGREVRAEARKVTWTSWKETWITSIMVGIMVILASLFFFGVDFGFGEIMKFVLKYGTGGQ